ncbi:MULTISPECIES: hypothetical protein [unclassified Mesorhizobium]|uniref:hypothetical protein n=1 Tax=unclassified Mesorhizobium TaxID=325217 RepID=UPI0013E3DB5C|nr:MULTISPECIES: hypothetical protein [unclassified Mesorhizobium]
MLFVMFLAMDDPFDDSRLGIAFRRPGGHVPSCVFPERLDFCRPDLEPVADFPEVQ